VFLPAVPAVGTGGGLLPAGEAGSRRLSRAFWEALLSSPCHSLPAPSFSKGDGGSSGKQKSVLGLCMYLSCALVKPGLFCSQ